MTRIEKDSAMAEVTAQNAAPAANLESCALDGQCAQGLAYDSIELFDLTISRLSRAEVFERISDRIAKRTPGIVVTPNVDHICRCHVDPLFREAYASAFLSLPDGMPILWTAKLVGKPLKEKLSGSDMVPLLAEYAASRGHSVFFLGAAEGVAEEAKEELRRRFPNLSVKGVYSPPMNFERDERENARVIQMLRDAAPDICFLALGSPRQEIWMYRNSVASGVPVMIGIGAGLDFIAGRVRRAPVLLQQVGLEWFWRLCMEPRRLWRRYLVEDSVFFALVWREFWKSRHPKSKSGR